VKREMAREISFASVATGRHRAVAIAVACAVALFAALVATAPSAAPSGAMGAKPKGLEGPRVPAGLSLRQLAGQRVIYSYSGLTPPRELLEVISAGEAGGVIFFGENVKSRPQIRRVIVLFQRANRESPVDLPLLMMTDQEGGIVKRIPGAPVLSAKEMGESPRPFTRARLSGRAAGKNLRGVGVNVNLAPVLGVFRQPGDFLDQFQRSFGSVPGRVARLGKNFITGQQEMGVAATSKHFPGLGAATAQQNTDEGPVTLDLSLQELESVDLFPYPDAIAAGTELVMCSWAIYPALDPNRPAGLSPTIVRGLLREELGFGGVTITDALEAGALEDFGSIPERGVLAAQAGMDILLYSNRFVGEGASGLDALVAALRAGELDRRQFRASVARVLELRERLAAEPPEPLRGP
jgi:beta-N-acetylhexosaminidase